MSARTIIAAPVIWFGSWLLSVITCFLGLLRIRCCERPSFGLENLGNKKGPQRPHAHRPNLDGLQPPPAVRLGTTTIRSLVIILRILGLGLPKGCAKHSAQTPDVKGRRRDALDSELSEVPGVRRERKCSLQPCADQFLMVRSASSRISNHES